MPTLRLYLETACTYALETARSYAPRAPLDDRIEAFRVFCLALKMIAYARLLLESDVRGFFVNLHRVAVNGCRCLRMVRAESQESQRIPTSHNDPLLAAVVTDAAFAGEIAALSTREQTPPEYEDEFYGALFLQESVRPRRPEEPPADLDSMCQRIDDYLEKETAHTRALRALARQDWSRFDPVFRDWNAEAARTLELAANSPGATYSMGLTQHIWLEGLAVLKLAERQGFVLAPALRPKLPGLVLEARSSPVTAKPLLH